MEWGVLLSSLDNHCRQIILLSRTARKRKNRSIKSRDDVTRVLFLYSTEPLEKQSIRRTQQSLRYLELALNAMWVRASNAGQVHPNAFDQQNTRSGLGKAVARARSGAR
jgi:hypothetical protein